MTVLSILRMLVLMLLLPSLLHTQSADNLTLEQAIEIGLRNNYAIIISKNAAQIAANDASPGNAGLLPSVAATAGANKSRLDTKQQFASGQSSEQDGAQSTAYNAGISLTWTVFDGFNRVATMKQLSTQKDIGEISAKIEIENTIADIISAYNNIVQQQYLLAALQEAINISKEREGIAAGKYNIGSGSRLEWNRARVDLIADSSAYLRQEVFLANARVELNRLLARDSGIQFSISDSIYIKDDLEINNLKTAAMARNNTLQLAQKNIRLARLSLAEIRSEWLPEVSVNVGYDYSKTESEAGFFLYNRNRRFNYGVTASLNLFDGFNTRRKAQNAEIDIRNSELEYSDIKGIVESDLAKIYKSYLASLQIVQLESENVRLARQNTNIALEQFRLGSITSVDLREVQNNFVDSETRFIAAQLEAKLAETELLRLSGELVR